MNQTVSPRKRMAELLAIPDSQRTDAEWDELNELEISMAPGNRIGGKDPVAAVGHVGGQQRNRGRKQQRPPMQGNGNVAPGYVSPPGNGGGGSGGGSAGAAGGADPGGKRPFKKFRKRQGKGAGGDGGNSGGNSAGGGGEGGNA